MSNTDEWISEYPALRDFIVNGLLSDLLSKSRPARGIKIGDEQWRQVVTQIGPLSSDVA